MRFHVLWSKSNYWLLIAVVILLALFPLSFHFHIPKWDSVRGYLPYRFFISDYLQDGHMPLWNPFQRLGYPGYSDLQSGCWYPITWLIMLFGQYDIASLISEVIITFVVAGWGMFRLSSYVHGCNRTAFLLALSYALSGCMVGSAQLMVFLIGMAWLPWILYAFIRILKGGGARYAGLLAFFLMCNITGASPAFTIVLVYALPLIFLYYLWRASNRSVLVKHFVFQGLITLSLLLLLLAPFIVAFVDFMPYFNRNGKLPYEAITLNPFVWSDYISFLFPYSVLSTHEMFQVTDLSLRNAYVGIVGLIFFFATIVFVRRAQWFWGLIAVVLISLILALGDYSGIYRAVYHLPGFGLFRHPAFFRGYAMFCVLLLAGFSIPNWLAGKMDFSRSFFIGCFSFLLLVMGGALLMSEPKSIIKTIHEIVDGVEFPAHGFSSQLFVNASLLLMLLASIVWIARSFALDRFSILVLLVVMDLFIQTRLSAPTTLHHTTDYASTKFYFENLEMLPEHDQWSNSTPLKLLDEKDGLLKTEALVANISTFNRRISSVGENPLRFRSFDEAKESGMLNWVLENPLMYFPERVCMDGVPVGPGYIFNTAIHLDNIGTGCRLDSVIVGYNLYQAVVTNPTENERWLVLNTNYHHLWKAHMNGMALPISRVNHLAMGILIPANSNGKVLFEFDSPFLPWAIALACIGFIVLFLIMIASKKAPRVE